MKTFIMIRNNDESGVSGIGKVLEGVVFSNGEVAAHWFGAKQSISLFSNLDDFIAIHITSHPSNLTELHWENGNIDKY